MGAAGWQLAALGALLLFLLPGGEGLLQTVLDKGLGLGQIAGLVCEAGQRPLTGFAARFQLNWFHFIESVQPINFDPAKVD